MLLFGFVSEHNILLLFFNIIEKKKTNLYNLSFFYATYETLILINHLEKLATPA